MSDITIVGGGWSVRQINLSRLPGLVIGVNDSAIVLPRCDIAISMDRIWIENRAEILRSRKMRTFIRRSTLKNVEPWPEMTAFECDHTSTVMADQPGKLNGTNSGMCGLNLAYQLRPSRIFLCGFDMSRGPLGEPYHYPAYAWASPAGATSDGKYAAWARQFGPAAAACQAAGIEVFNVSPTSAVDAFRRITPAEMESLS